VLLGVDEQSQNAAGATAQGNAATEPKAPREKKAPKPFEFKSDKRGLNVPGFKWKAGEGTDKLEVYVDALKKVLEYCEEQLTKPQA
jgi:hypothetical protein